MLILSFFCTTDAEPAGIAPRPCSQALQYRIERGAARELASRFTPRELELLEKLNRADVKHLPRLSRLVVPLDWRTEIEHCPLPITFAAATARPKLLLVHQAAQVFGAYEYGALVRWGPTSTGRQAKPTPTGLYHLNWRARSRTSTLSGEWQLNWYFNFHNQRGLAFHEFDLPGVPASHACVRLLMRDAVWIYNWGDAWKVDANEQLVEAGTPVLIFGEYNFATPPPWWSADFWMHPLALPPSF